MKMEADKQEIAPIIAEILSEFPVMHGAVMIARENEILWHQGFSYVDVPLNTDKHAQYLIASLTKQFTAAALLKALYDYQMNNVLKNLQEPLAFWLSSEHKIWNGNMQKWAYENYAPSSFNSYFRD